MTQDMLHVWGKPCGSDELKYPRAIALSRAARLYPHAALLGVRRRGDHEGLLFEFRVGLSQRPPVPILGREPVAIVFGPDDHAPPRAVSLRKDFPDVLHLNLTVSGEPKEFCLFDRPYRDIKSRLTPLQFLDRVGDWLERAAIDELHRDDQPLEPMLLNNDRIIIDAGPLESRDGGPPLLGTTLLSKEPLLLRMQRLPQDLDPQGQKGLQHLAIVLRAKPWNHRILSQFPRDLAELVAVLAAMALDLTAEIGRFILDLAESAPPRLQVLRDCFLVVLLEVPKTRVEGGPVEVAEWWAFLIPAGLGKIAVKLGIMAESDGRLGRIVGAPQPRVLETIPVAPLRPIFAFSRLLAQAVSGYSGSSPNIVAVGVGALGSQVVANLARQGFGSWTIVDHDLLLPHNLARHALFWPHEGNRKAEALAWEIRNMLQDEESAQALPVDLLAPREAAEALADALRDSEIILDLSASAAVTRQLAHADSDAARTCAFIGPTGRHLVVLSEGAGRRVRLDDLEQQFAACVAADDFLHGVFGETAGSVAFAGSCREVSVQLPQDVVAIFTGVMAHFVKTHHADPQPSIRVWEWSPGTLDLRHHAVPVHQVVIIEHRGWTVRISSHVVEAMRSQRLDRLPNETGGVLLGEFDHDQRIIYVAHVLPSPPDSIEWPTVYIRGVEGLREQVEEISATSGNNLSYVGEWHSHPDGHGNSPSDVDREALRRLAEELKIEGIPALVLIQGQDDVPGALISGET